MLEIDKYIDKIICEKKNMQQWFLYMFEFMIKILWWNLVKVYRIGYAKYG